MWFDAAVVESVVESLPLWAAFVVLGLSYVGSIYVIVPLTIAVYLRDRAPRASYWPVVVLSAYALFVFMKPLSGIERPEVDSPLAEVSLPVVLEQLHQLAVGFETESFPSGHAIAATVFYGLILVDTEWRTPWNRTFGIVVVLLSVYFSRVALGVHFIGDVVGGALIGIVFLAFLLWLHERFEAPEKTVLVIPVSLALGGVVVGEVTEGVALLGAIGGFYLFQTKGRTTLHTFFGQEASPDSDG